MTFVFWIGIKIYICDEGITDRKTVQMLCDLDFAPKLNINDNLGPFTLTFIL